MIDYVKIRINDTDLAERLRKNPKFEFFSEINPETGELRDGKLKAKLINLNVRLYPSGMVEVTGSLHKYANNGEHNYDAFTFCRLVKIIGEVAKILDTPAERLNVHNIEFGVNILLDIPPSLFLNNVLNYRFKLPDVRTFRGKGKLLQWVQQNYVVKVYDKKHQYRLISNVLRFEVKVMAMAYLRGIELRTLADLLDVSTLRQLGAKLCESYKGLIIGEKLNKEQMKRPEKSIYEKGMNPNFWRDMTDRKKRNYYRNQFESVIKKYGVGARETVGKLIEDQFDILIKSSDILPDTQNQKFGHFTTSNRGVKHPTISNQKKPLLKTIQRVCKVCNSSIEHRRKGALYCEKKQCRNKVRNSRYNLSNRINVASSTLVNIS